MGEIRIDRDQGSKPRRNLAGKFGNFRCQIQNANGKGNEQGYYKHSKYKRKDLKSTNSRGTRGPPPDAAPGSTLQLVPHC